MQFPAITACLAAFFALFMVMLSGLTSLRRATLHVTHGDGGDDVLRRRIRAHGNFIEYAPFAVILTGLIALSGAPRTFMMLLALAMGFARLAHAAGMLYTSGPALRAVAMLVQHSAFVFGAIVLLKGAFYFS